MNKFYTKITFLFLFFSLSLSAQQLPNNHFEDWSGAAFDGVAQPASWNYCNVTQTVAGINASFNFAHKEDGRNGGYCMMVQDQDLKVAGFGETSPGYVTLGHPWVYLNGVEVKKATAGTYGGMAWKYRPDTIAVWIKRTGSNAMSEDFHILYYAWSGTAYGDKYKGKDGTCSSTSKTDEESDIRQSTDGNECGTTTYANQIAEGWLRQRAIYNDWVQIKVPIYYINNDVPEKMNVIFSASNYPNFRANSGLYAGNSLYIDDAELIYSSKIQQLIIGGDEWKSFNPNSTATQTYILADGVETIPTIKAMRGIGQLTNSKGEVTNFRGRKLDDSEITITPGEIDKTPTLITVKAEDGSSEMTYRIQFSHKLSNNAYLGGMLVNGQSLKGFSPYNLDYTVEVEYGVTQVPTITVIKQEEEQQITLTPANSLDEMTTIVVRAADGQTTKTYTIHYKQAPLNDNTLKDILVNGVSVPDFSPTKTNYKVSLPLGTTEMPVVTPVSNYAEGLQTIVATAPDKIDGGVYKISVSSPGNPSAKDYKLTFALEQSAYCKLKNIFVNGEPLADFSADNTTYTLALPTGTTSIPEITWEQGDPYQQIELIAGGVDGTTRIVVTAANGTQMTYRIQFSTVKSTISTLDGILLNGEGLAGFDKNITSYNVQLPIGTTSLPNIEVIQGDAYQQVTVISGGLNGTTRITVVAGNGCTTIYQITFSVLQATNSTLLDIKIDGVSLVYFHADTLEYFYELPHGTTQLPVVEYTAHDSYQSITCRSNGVNGDYRITVRPQSGASRTYIIHFSVQKSSNTALKMIYLDGERMADFDPERLDYTDTLETAIIPNVSYDGEAGQKIFMLYDNNVYTIKVSAENGDSRIYTISFVVKVSQNAFLQMIYLDGDSLKDFQPTRLHYTDIPIRNHTCPTISVDSEEGQQVTILTPVSAGTASIIVTAGSGDNNTYLIELVDTAITPTQPLEPDSQYIPSTDATLRAILVNGEALSTYVPSRTSYTLELPKGDTIPTVAFIPNTDKQSVISGRVAPDQFAAFVTAENGDTTRYVVNVNIAPYDTPLLTHLAVEGQTCQFDAHTLDYEFAIIDGEALPKVRYAAEPGASTLFSETDADHQQIIVTAENGAQNIYTIAYVREKSSYALLSDLLIDGKRIANFDVNRFHYTDTLARHSVVVPVVNAIPGHARQTITTSYGAVGRETRIHVEAADGKTTADYTIAFPVYQSGNVLLSNLEIETDYAHQFEFTAEESDYLVTLPYNATISPVIHYEKAEKEQTISVVLRPMGQKNEIIVEAENGDKHTYSITFKRDNTPANRLKSIQYVLNNQDIHDLALQENQYEYTIDLPYGTNMMDISYAKAFDEQTVIVQPGGIYHPTILTVYNHLQSNQPAVYRITPVVSAFRPAALNGIAVDDIAIADFDPNQLTYIVHRSNTSNVPSVTVAKASAVSATQETNLWRSTITAVCDQDTAVYHLYFHYPNDTIPNGEFTEWGKTNVSNSDKPISWNVPGDYLGTYAGTAKAGEAISKSTNSVVRFTTKYWGALYGAVPPVINLASMTANFAVAGGTTVTPSGTNRFYNSPDQAIINYNYPDKAGNGALFRFRLADLNGITDIDHWQKSETETFADYTVELNTNGKNITGLDIIVDATGKYPKAPTGPTTDCKSELNLDYIRFLYNNTLTRVWVNGKEAVRDGDSFSHTISSSLDIAVPMLQFEGEVSDQAQKVDWQAEVAENGYGVRRATITNYGEDGNYSTYTLEVKRPIDTQVALKTIQINNIPLQSFKADQLSYTYVLPYGTAMPDVVPVLSNKLQTCSVSCTDSVVAIVVTSEEGETRSYTISFQYETPENTLANVAADGITFDPAQPTYTIPGEEMPTVAITKRYDEQTVTMNQGRIEVSLPGMSTTYYTIALIQDSVITSGQLQELELDGNLLPDFDPNTYVYEHDLPAYISFKRQDDVDSVVYIRKPDTLYWHVFGSESHTYQLTSVDENSSATSLQGIYIGDTLVRGFNPQIDSYTIWADSAIQLRAVGVDARQQIAIQYAQSTYTIAVTSPDHLATATYTLDVVPTTSSDAHLTDIALNGQALASFQKDQYTYTIELPVEDAYKNHEPTIPSISFVAANAKATVEIEANPLGETTYLFVTSHDQSQSARYELYFAAEPSHNAYLSAIAINNIPLNNFQPDRFNYSVMMSSEDVQLDFRSHDRYQDVTMSHIDNLYTLHVVAQDGVTSHDYTIEVFSQAKSKDATIADITLNGAAMSAYYPELNPDLTFDPGLNKYQIHIPSRLANLPDITVSLKQDGQAVQIDKQQKTINIQVTAPDGVTHNTYTLQFIESLSTNTQLRGILVDTTSLQNFNPDTLFYYITLAKGEHTIPDITPLWDKQTQKVNVYTSALPIGEQVVIDVTAEDGSTHAQYMLLFQLSPSDIDTLRMIYEDGQVLRDFDAHTYQYTIEVPRSVETFPVISWEEGDAYQSVVTDTLIHTVLLLSCNYIVTAESGKTSTYQISYFKQASTNTYLRNIYVNSQPLAAFDSLRNDYMIALKEGEVIQSIFWEESDKYQTITICDTISALAANAITTKQIHVVAENGDEQTYTLCFVRALSTDSTLTMIYYNGQPISTCFDELNANYIIPLTQHGATMPLITYDKKNQQQQIEMRIIDPLHMQLWVSSEDGLHHFTYEIACTPYLSNNAYLEELLVNNTLIANWSPLTTDYDIAVDSIQNLPKIDYRLAEPAYQTVQTDTTYSETEIGTYVIVTLQVIAENNIEFTEYAIKIYIRSTKPFAPEDSENSRLSMITIRGDKLSKELGFNQDFAPEVTDYYLTYPIGTDPSVLITESDVDALTEDSLAIVNKSIEHLATVTDTANHEMVVGTCIHIIVKAPAGHSTIYNIYQNVRLDSINHATELLIADNDGIMQPLKGFSPDILYYEYILSETASNAPQIDLRYSNTNSRFACVRHDYSNDSRIVDCTDNTNYAQDDSNTDPTYHIYYRAENGTRYTYKIKFRRSEIKRSLQPMEGDVLIQPIPGTHQLAIASLRSNVLFGLYDMSGRMVELVKLPESNPNSFSVTTDGYGQTYLGHLTDFSSCAIINIEPNKLYFWVFTENGKRKIKSGKIIILP